MLIDNVLFDSSIDSTLSFRQCFGSWFGLKSLGGLFNFFFGGNVAFAANDSLLGSLNSGFDDWHNSPFVPNSCFANQVAIIQIYGGKVNSR